MIIYLGKGNNIRNDNFYLKFIPEVIKLIITKNCIKNNNGKSKIFKIFEDEFKVSAADVINSIDDFIRISENRRYYIYTIDRNQYFGKEKYITLLSFLDEGNLQVKGLGIFKTITEELRRNKCYYDLFKYYEMCGRY